MVLHPSCDSLNPFCFLQLANPISVDTVVAAISSAALWKNIKNAVITTCKPWVSQATSIQVIKVPIWGLALFSHVLRKRISEGTAVPLVASLLLERQSVMHIHAYHHLCDTASGFILYLISVWLFSFCSAQIKSQSESHVHNKHLPDLEYFSSLSQYQT